MATRRQLLKSLLVAPAAAVAAATVSGQEQVTQPARVEWPIEAGEELIDEMATREYIFLKVRNSKTGQIRTKRIRHPQMDTDYLLNWYRQKLWCLKNARGVRRGRNSPVTWEVQFPGQLVYLSRKQLNSEIGRITKAIRELK